jgi:hypothetical protein
MDDACTVESLDCMTRRPNGCIGTVKSPRTSNSGQTICYYVRTNATLNSSKILDTDGHPDGFASSFGLLDWVVLMETLDPTSLSGNLHIIFLEY